MVGDEVIQGNVLVNAHHLNRWILLLLEDQIVSTLHLVDGILELLVS